MTRLNRWYTWILFSSLGLAGINWGLYLGQTYPLSWSSLNTQLVPALSGFSLQAILLLSVIILGVWTQNQRKLKRKLLEGVAVLGLSINLLGSLFSGITPDSLLWYPSGLKCGNTVYVTTLGKESHRYHRLGLITMTYVDTYMTTWRDGDDPEKINYARGVGRFHDPDLLECLENNPNYRFR